MAYEIEVVEVTATQLAAVAAQAEPADFARQIRRQFDQVYAFLKTHELVTQVGHNVITYDGPLTTGSHIEMGVQVAAAFQPEGEIISTTTPAGRVARTVHVGGYSGLPQAHAAIFEWCKERGLTPASRSWEIYGDHDPKRLRTEVFRLLA